uniref:Uncharacterized protein n=1 Tax=Anguilla anguilla TaxID=7936 RepID=A0A0E9QH53_ANGAN
MWWAGSQVHTGIFAKTFTRKRLSDDQSPDWI